MAVTDDDALRAFRELARLEGIIPALEPAHAIAWLLANRGPPDRDAASFDVLTLSGRGDKDLAEVVERARRWLIGSPPAFAAAAGEGRAALMPYMMGGFPDRETAAAVADAYADAGADLIELGVPYSDPLADGPVIHAAATRALAAGATLDTVLEDLRAVRRAGPGGRRWPTRTWSSPAAPERFAAALADAGGAGAIVPDLPLEEGAEISAALRGRRARAGPAGRADHPAGRAGRQICAAARGLRLPRLRHRARPASATSSRQRSASWSPATEGRRAGPGRGRLRDRDARAGGGRSGAIADGVIVGTRLVRAVAEADGAAAAAPGRGRVPRRRHAPRCPRSSGVDSRPCDCSSSPSSGLIALIVAYAFSLGGTVAALIFLFILFNGVLDRWAQPLLDWMQT